MTEKSRADTSLTKSDLIESLSRNQRHLERRDVELAVKGLLEKMSQELASGNRIEIRGFGSFSLHFRAARMGRNPKSGDAVPLRGKYVPHFKPGKELRERVNSDIEVSDSHANNDNASGRQSDGNADSHSDV